MSNVATAEVTIKRDHWNKLSATSVVDLGSERRRLRFSTYKGSRGLQCSAHVEQVSEDGNSFTHAIGFGICGDYTTRLAVDPAARGTEKAIRALHAKCLSELGDATLAAAINWYATGRNVRS